MRLRADAWHWMAAAVAGGTALAAGLHVWHEPAGAGVYAQLEQQLQRHPGDERSIVLKARLDMAAQRWPAAAEGYAKAVAGGRKTARDAGVWVEYAEARGMLQGRSLLGEPQRLVQQALALDPMHPKALDLAGSAAWEARDYAQAARYWQRLLQQIPQDDPRHGELASAVETAERRARFALPQEGRMPRHHVGTWGS